MCWRGQSKVWGNNRNHLESQSISVDDKKGLKMYYGKYILLFGSNFDILFFYSL